MLYYFVKFIKGDMTGLSAEVCAEQFGGEVKGNHGQDLAPQGQLLHGLGHEEGQQQGEHDTLMIEADLTEQGQVIGNFRQQ